MSAAAPIVRHKLTVTDYHRMAEVGILTPDARVELIEGEIIDMTPIGSKHGSVVDRLARLLDRAVGEQAIVRTQGSIRLNRYSEPQPDIALLRYRSDFYADSLPAAGDIVLVVEVAESTLNYDKDVKATLYAKAGIPEYWLIDIEQSQILTHQRPSGGVYGEIRSIAHPGVMPVRELEKVSIDLSDLVRTRNA